MSITVAPGNYTINLAVDPTDNNKKLRGGRYVWSISGNTSSTLTPTNDGLSALLHIVNGETVTVNVANQNGSRWQPGKFYFLGDQVIDAAGHTQQVTAASKKVPAIYTPEAGKVPQSGDAAVAFPGTKGGVVQYGTVLNQGDGDINGDWPAGALLQDGANTNEQKKGAHFTINSDAPTSAAPVAFAVGGFSHGRNAAGQDPGSQAGIESPNATGNDTRSFIAEYSEIGAGGQKVYLDAAGNSHTGWEVARGTQNFALNLNEPPAFSGAGGTVVDNDLVWTDEGAAADADTWGDNLVVIGATGALAPAYNYILMPLE